MKIALVTGSAGLVGSEAVEFLSPHFDEIVGIDNDLRAKFFGPGASTRWNRRRLSRAVKNYRHLDFDIRDGAALERLFRRRGRRIRLIVHAAAQPSHDWAARDPQTDFAVNAGATLSLLEGLRRHAPHAAFIFTSTSKVYGDTPNFLPLEEKKTRWEIRRTHPYFRRGIDESMPIDRTTHSLFGASKLAADVLVQEYGRYFGLRTGVFRCGCVAGPKHSGAALHGFLAYLVRCALEGREYVIYGYKGKQVRDNIHSYDLVSMFWHFYKKPRPGEVYNAGGGRFSNCSVLEAIALAEEATGRRLRRRYDPKNRLGDHVWWISDVSKFRSHYPAWRPRFGLRGTLEQIRDAYLERGLGQ